MRRLTLIGALAVALAAAGCGGGEDDSATPETIEGTPPADTSGGGASEGDAEAGADVYASAGCGGCHTFEPAGSTGTAGPSLDDSTADFEAAVAQIRNGGGGMPAFEGQLDDQQIADVAAFVTQD